MYLLFEGSMIDTGIEGGWRVGDRDISSAGSLPSTGWSRPKQGAQNFKVDNFVWLSSDAINIKIAPGR